MRSKLTFLKEFLIVELAAFLHWLLRSTWKLKRGTLPPEIQKRIDEGKPVIFGHLHQDDVSLIAFFVGVRVGVLVSQSKDGNLLSRYFHKIGWVTARGSSSRGAASGFLELLRLCKTQNLSWITFAVDGPRGPVGKTKNGIFKLAGILEAPIIPVVALADKRWTFKKSWMKTFIAKPFTTLEFKYLEPIPVDVILKGTQEKNYAELAAVFDQRIFRAKASGYIF